MKLTSLFKSAWLSVTAPALKQTTGQMETAFFESVYRIMYAWGISLADNLSPIYQIYSYTVKLFIVLFVGSELWYLFSISSSLDTVIDNINITIIHLITMYRYKSMMDCKGVYKKLATSMESPYFDVFTPNRKKILKSWVQMQNRYYTILLTLGTLTLSVWYVYPLTDSVEYNFPAAVLVPFEYRSTGRYIITYIIVLVMFHYISYFVISVDLSMQTHLIHLISQFDILCDCFENIIVDCSDGLTGLTDSELFANNQFQDTFVGRLRNLVEQHKIILKHSQELRQVLSAPMLGQLMASGSLICLAGYQVTTTVTTSLMKFTMSVLYLCYNLYTFYVLCSWCDEIKMQSQRVGESIYQSGWERGLCTLPGARARFMIVVARANQPVVLSAGGLYDISLVSYTTLVKTSYSALTLLLRARRRNTP